MTTSREDFEALMPEPAAYCEPDNPLNSQAFAWPGLGRGFMHTAPLYTADQMRAMFEAATERAAKVAEPKGPRPCDCQVCDCGNRGDAQAVADWDASAAIAAGIRGIEMSRRADFEAHMSSRGRPVGAVDHQGTYISNAIQSEWVTWQAAMECAAKLCDAERAEFIEQARQNNGRGSDFAFGSVNSAERLAAAIRGTK